MSAWSHRFFGLVACGAVWLGSACSAQVSSGKGSETNWLAGCASDDDCRVGRCVCGVCTLPCDSSSKCPGGSQPDTCAVSGSSAFSALCGAPVTGTSGVCVSGCGSGGPCASGFECVDGSCLPKTGMVTSGVMTEVFGAFGTYTYFEGALFQQPSGTPSKCLPRSLPTAADGSIACTVLKFSPGDVCDCSAPGLSVPEQELLAPMKRLEQRAKACGGDSQPPCAPTCACAVRPFGGSEKASCLEDPNFDTPSEGYCYVDPDQQLGSSAVVDGCPSNQRRQLRFGGTVVQGGMYTIACISKVSETDSSSGVGRLGAVCIPSEENDPGFSGRSVEEVGVELGSGDCATGVCLVNHFRGRVTCPYGQDPTVATSAENSCFTPDSSHQLVTVKVDSQIVLPVRRRPEDAMYCSCRCDGPDKTADYCRCPTGFECTPLVDDIGKGMSIVEGSYCVKVGTDVSNPSELLSSALGCVRPNCGP